MRNLLATTKKDLRLIELESNRICGEADANILFTLHFDGSPLLEITLEIFTQEGIWVSYFEQ